MGVLFFIAGPQRMLRRGGRTGLFGARVTVPAVSAAAYRPCRRAGIFQPAPYGPDGPRGGYGFSGLIRSSFSLPASVRRLRTYSVGRQPTCFLKLVAK